LYDEAVWLAIRVLDQVKIPDPERIARQYPYELSGGMQQRALIAIALSCNPKLLIADEPTTALDVTIQAQILELIRDMKKAFGSSVLLITHDLGIIAEICTRVCVMYAGCIVEDSSVRSVFKESLHPYTQGLMKAIPSHTVRKDTLEIIRGSVPNLIYPPPGCRFHPRCPAVMADCGWSPGEVGSQLWDALREMAGKEPWGFDVEALEWSEVGPTELRVVFPEGTSLQVGVSSLRVAVEMGQGRGRPAFGAIRSVESPSPWGGGEPPRHAVVHILEPRKPPSFVPEPGHSVACLLYEEGMTPFPRGAADAG
jgi:oligopeptide/dipeptide ABC transporter ATP-binding protein